jgi:hypothetical protein
MGPNEGNVIGQIMISVWESYDQSDERPTLRTLVAYLDATNQVIVWDQASRAAFMNCERIRHLVDRPVLVIGPPRPGDPPHFEERVREAISDLNAAQSNLKDIAALVAEHRPELAAALTFVGSTNLTDQLTQNFSA